MSRHDHRGLPKKGEPSRNPSGRPKVSEGVREAIRADTKIPDLISRTAKGELTPEERKSIDKDMLKYWFDQGHGRAPQTINLGGSVTLRSAVGDFRAWVEEKGLLEDFERWVSAQASKKP